MTTDRRAPAVARATTDAPRPEPQTVPIERTSRITGSDLTRWAGAAAVAAGLLFIGVQVNHPHLDATTIATTDAVLRNALKVVMVGLTLVGITGMYLRHVKQTGVLGFVGYVVFATGYLILLGTTFAAAFVLPAIADTHPGFVDDALAVAAGRTPVADIGAWATVMQLQGAGFLAGALLFGAALFRARVLVRWATALLAVSGLLTAALSVMPDAAYRYLAWPNGVAMVVLGYALWRSVREDARAGAAS